MTLLKIFFNKILTKVDNHYQSKKRNFL